MIKVTVKLDKAAIAKIEKAVLDSAQAAMEQVVTEVQNTAPLDQGDLINGIFVRSEKSGNTVIATIDHSGATLTIPCVINVTEWESGDSTAVAPLAFDIMSDGQPTYTPTE